MYTIAKIIDGVYTLMDPTIYMYTIAKIIDGVYTLIDPTEKEDINDFAHGGRATEHEREKIRMPPSLTLSKIRR